MYIGPWLHGQTSGLSEMFFHLLAVKKETLGLCPFRVQFWSNREEIRGIRQINLGFGASKLPSFGILLASIESLMLDVVGSPRCATTPCHIYLMKKKQKIKQKFWIFMCQCVDHCSNVEPRLKMKVNDVILNRPSLTPCVGISLMCAFFTFVFCFFFFFFCEL